MNKKITLNYAVVIPCYNEEKRLPYDQFLSFAQKEKEVLLCFVNDGSTDKTMSVLRALEYESPENIVVLDLAQNGGKAEAVRQGMLYIYEHYSCDSIGFLDADLATVPEEYLAMAKYKEEKMKYGAIVGSRIQRMGAAISRDNSRTFFSAVVKTIIKKLLKTQIQDTQCGAKVFHRVLVPFIFNQPFHTPWLFDVEIFLRIQKKFGQSTLEMGILEYPLMQWTEIGGSKLNWKASIRIPFQLLNLYRVYNYPTSKTFSWSSQSTFNGRRLNPLY